MCGYISKIKFIVKNFILTLKLSSMNIKSQKLKKYKLQLFVFLRKKDNFTEMSLPNDCELNLFYRLIRENLNIKI